MESTVPFWETESLTLHLIENDLNYTRLSQDCSNLSMKNLNRLNLYESLFWLLGIYESESQTKMLRYYVRERNKCDDPLIPAKVYAEELYVNLLANPKTEKLRMRQLAYDYDLNNNGIDKLTKNLIRNDLIFIKLSNRLDKHLINNMYESTLYKPILWLMRQWDIKSLAESELFYFDIRKRVNEIKLGRNSEELDKLTTDVFHQLRTQIENVTMLED